MYQRFWNLDSPFPCLSVSNWLNVSVYVWCLLYSVYETELLECVCFLYPSCQCIIDLDGPVGTVLTADRDTRDPAISQMQPAHYPWTHDNSCLVPAQGQGCNCTHYVMKRRRGREQWREGFYWDVSQCIIAHIANRLPVTRSGWGLLLTDSSILLWLQGGASWSPRGPRHKMRNCGVLGLNPTKHMCCMSVANKHVLLTSGECDSKLCCVECHL